MSYHSARKRRPFIVGNFVFGWNGPNSIWSFAFAGPWQGSLSFDDDMVDNVVVKLIVEVAVVLLVVSIVESASSFGLHRLIWRTSVSSIEFDWISVSLTSSTLSTIFFS